MKRLAQARHVAVKDVRVARNWIGGWLLLLGAAVVSTAAPVHAADGAAALRGVLVVAVAMLLAALFVQYDAAVERDAFWVTRPLTPAAVWLGKVMVTAIVLMLPALAVQAVAVAAHDADFATHVRILAASGAILAFWTTFAMVVAASTRSMRMFVLVTVGLITAALVVNTAIVARSHGPGIAYTHGGGVALLDPAHPLWRVVWPVLLLAIAALQYRKGRAARPLVPIAAAGVILSLGLAAWLSAATRGTARSPHSDAVELTATLAYSGALDNGVARYALHMALPQTKPGERYTLDEARAWIIRSDGRRDDVGVVHPRGRSPVAVNLGPEQVMRLSTGGGILVVVGRLYRQQLRHLPPLPTEAGRVTAGAGVRARIVEWHAAYASVDIVITDVSDRRRGPTFDRYEFSLASAAGERRLSTYRTEGTSYSLVLPRAVRVERMSLQPAATRPGGHGAATTSAEVPPDAVLSIRIWHDVEQWPLTVRARF
jgi:hypothetical protein